MKVWCIEEACADPEDNIWFELLLVFSSREAALKRFSGALAEDPSDGWSDGDLRLTEREVCE